jgi:hypothetical protein
MLWEIFLSIVEYAYLINLLFSFLLLITSLLDANRMMSGGLFF